jgi:hypothetical protein
MERSGAPVVTSGEEEPRFDVDDLVRRIDAKIAELEAEEAREKAAQTGSSSDSSQTLPLLPPIAEETSTMNNSFFFDDEDEATVPSLPPIAPTNKVEEKYDKLESTIYERFDDFYSGEDNFSLEEPTMVEVDAEAKVVVEDSVTDDQFFDDFYDDDERD